MNGRRRDGMDRAFGGVLLGAAGYALARVFGWTGGATPLEFSQPAMDILLIAGSVWGLKRLSRIGRS